MKQIRGNDVPAGRQARVSSPSRDVDGLTADPRRANHVGAARFPGFQLPGRVDHGWLQQGGRGGLALDEFTLKKIGFTDLRHVPLAQER